MTSDRITDQRHNNLTNLPEAISLVNNLATPLEDLGHLDDAAKMKEVHVIMRLDVKECEEIGLLPTSNVASCLACLSAIQKSVHSGGSTSLRRWALAASPFGRYGIYESCTPQSHWHLLATLF